jgi:hypothetical protein
LGYHAIKNVVSDKRTKGWGSVLSARRGGRHRNFCLVLGSRCSLADASLPLPHFLSADLPFSILVRNIADYRK